MGKLYGEQSGIFAISYAQCARARNFVYTIAINHGLKNLFLTSTYAEIKHGHGHAPKSRPEEKKGEEKKGEEKKGNGEKRHAQKKSEEGAGEILVW